MYHTLDELKDQENATRNKANTSSGGKQDD